MVREKYDRGVDVGIRFLRSAYAYIRACCGSWTGDPGGGGHGAGDGGRPLKHPPYPLKRFARLCEGVNFVIGKP